MFYLNVLNETLAYQVIQISTVLPYETELLSIVPGADLCTLVTCTPYPSIQGAVVTKIS